MKKRDLFIIFSNEDVEMLDRCKIKSVADDKLSVRETMENSLLEQENIVE